MSLCLCMLSMYTQRGTLGAVNQLLCASGILGAYIVGIAVQSEQATNIECNPSEGIIVPWYSIIYLLYTVSYCHIFILFSCFFSLFLLFLSSSSPSHRLHVTINMCQCLVCMYIDDMSVLSLYGTDTDDLSCSQVVTGWKCAKDGYCEVNTYIDPFHM